MNTNKTISLLSILSLFVAGATSAYTPKTMLNGKLVNVGVPYGVESGHDQDKLWSVNTNAFYLHQRLGETDTHTSTSHIGGILGSGSVNLDQLAEGLSLNVHVPVVYTSNTTETKECKTEDKSAHESNNDIAINDIDVAVSYNVLNQDGQKATLSAGVTIPTAGKHNHFNTAEPRLGNGGHIGLFLDGEMQNNIFSNEDHRVSIVSELTYRYLFANIQKRTIAALAGDLANSTLLNKDGKSVSANEALSAEIDVTPGSQFDGRLGVLYEHSIGVFLGAGVTGHYRSREKAKLSQAFDANKFADQIAKGFAIKGTDDPIDLDPSDIEVNKAKTIKNPAQLAIRGYADLGYNFEVCELPAFVSVGVDMPMVTKTWETKECKVATTENFFKNNNFFKNVDFNVKAGISF